jgi:chromosome segregation ATPase
MKHEHEFKMWWERQEIWRTEKLISDAMESLWEERDQLLRASARLEEFQQEINQAARNLAETEEELHQTESRAERAESKLEDLQKRVRLTGNHVRKSMRSMAMVAAGGALDSLREALDSHKIFDEDRPSG